MALPNLISLLLLSFTLIRIVNDYDATKKRAMARKRLMSTDMRKLLIVSVCATLLAIGMVYSGGSSRGRV